MTHNTYYETSLGDLFDSLYSLGSHNQDYRKMLLGNCRQVDKLIRQLRHKDGVIRLEHIERPPVGLMNEIVIDPEAEPMNPDLAERRRRIRAAMGFADILEFRMSRFGVSHDTGEYRVSRESTRNLVELMEAKHDEHLLELLRELNLPPRSVHAASIIMPPCALSSLLQRKNNADLRKMPSFSHTRGSDYTLKHAGIIIQDLGESPYYLPSARSESGGYRLGARGTAHYLLAAREFFGKCLNLMSADKRESLRHLLDIEEIIEVARKVFAKESIEDHFVGEVAQKCKPPLLNHFSESRTFFATIDIPPPPLHVTGHMAFYALPHFLRCYYPLQRGAVQPIAKMVEDKYGELVHLYETSRKQPTGSP